MVEAEAEAEAEAFEIHEEKNQEAEKMSHGKRNESTLLLHSNISGLPDDIIISILSRWTLKESARTSVVSQGWKNLWTWTTGSLCFDYLDEASREYLAGCRSEPSDNYLRGNEFRKPWRPLEFYKKPAVVEKSSFVACVNHVLSLHQGQTVDKFEICCTILGRLEREIISKWVEFALRKKVRSLRLDFRSPYSYMRGNYSIKKSFLTTCSLDSLTVLDLKNVDVTDNCISYILVKCQFLEELCVEKSSKLVELRVSGPLPQLKCLKIKYCLLLRCIEIRALSLNSFTYHGGDIPVTFEKPPRLIHAAYGFCYASVVTANMRQQFSSYATCLQSLLLNIHRHLAYPNDGLPDFPILENLRRLELGLHGIDVDSIITFVAPLLEKCPILETFSLKTAVFGLEGGVESSWLKRKGVCLHDSITVLELVDYRPWIGLRVEIAYFMVSTLPSL